MNHSAIPTASKQYNSHKKRGEDAEKQQPTTRKV